VRARRARVTGDDCTRCGACCVNPRENRDAGFHDWVEVRADDALARPRARAKWRKLLVVNERGELHLALDASQRCAALRGALGVRVRCAVYAERPRACRRVEPGSDRCLQYRTEHGFG